MAMHFSKQMAVLTNKRLLVIFGLLVVYLAYWWNANFHVPKNLEQREEVIMIYAVSKLSRMITHTENFNGVEVIIIEPFQKDDYGPGMVFYHGGGWVLGTASDNLEFLAVLSEALNMTIISVEYRMAPEHPFPTPLDDCFEATKYFFENSAKYNVDPFRIALAGFSAGGNLAAAMSIRMRDSALPWKNKVQVLLSPCLQAYNFDFPSYYYNELDEILPKFSMIEFWLWYALGHDGHHYVDQFMHSSHYHVIDEKKMHGKLLDWKSLGLPLNKSDVEDFQSKIKQPNIQLPVDVVSKLKATFMNPHFAPLMLKDFSGLAKAFVGTAEHDILRDEALLYAKYLKMNGNAVKAVNYNGAFHGLVFWNEHYNLPKRVAIDVIEFLKVNL
ncbi:hypothetical protein HELRODRAFT_168752 [Helobdella robusta]|uniref:Alpha/beta hydrolase fold-3 domain-containing protein n=1 Tax=Helobdella robusta TaxID=6412 RepID=T1F0X5_HELRO|nr:hypothetical protein HELRODRAFT_168752 [Helobdella robusta]ESO08841.1 hypothetical protein HELRODRAFT_168752 [Helobdella robusta]